MPIEGIIFDLDGVIVSTDDCHYKGWKQLANEEGIEFNHEINMRLRGVSRMQSLEILLEKANRNYSQEEKIQMAERKNGYYRELLKEIPDLEEGTREGDGYAGDSGLGDADRGFLSANALLSGHVLVLLRIR